MTRSRAAALAILAALVALLWVGPVAAYRDYLSGEARHLAELDAALVRDRALVAAPSVPGAIDGALLPPGISDAQAVALLQETLKSAAATAQVDIEGLQVMQADTLGGAPRLGVRLRGRAMIAGLDRLLYAIEASRPLLYPDNLRIEAHGRDGGGTLDFQLDVSGFRAAAPS
jgi:hypothetical protein